jgi:beta-phosphoglucomutase family hydrolase
VPRTSCTSKLALLWKDVVREMEAVIFDMDGLMIESEHLHSRSFEEVLKNHGAEPELNDVGVVQTLGIGTPNNWKKLKKKHGLEPSVEELTDQKHLVYEDLIPQVHVTPGLLELLNDLKKSGIKMAVASGSSKNNIDRILKQVNIKNYFEAIVSSDDVEHPKPSADIFLYAAQKLKVKPKNCIVLEDAQSGIEAAKAASMLAIAVPNQFSRNHDFSKADYRFNSLEELSASKLKELMA